jgi:hypothetical protein
MYQKRILRSKNPYIECFGRFTAHLQSFWALFALIFGSPAIDIVTSGVLGDVKYVEVDVIEYSNRSEPARNGFYAQKTPYIEILWLFPARFQCFWALFRSISGSPARDIVTSAVLGEVKYVELDVIERRNRAESARNELYARKHPYVDGVSHFAAIFQRLSTLFGLIFYSPARHVNSARKFSIFRLWWWERIIFQKCKQFKICSKHS